MLRPRLHRAALAAFLAAMPLLARVAAAQDAPPSPPRDPTISPLLGYLFILLLAGAVLSVSLYPSKRSHQDV